MTSEYKALSRLDDIISSVSEDAYEPCIGDSVKEEKFWNNFVQIAAILEHRIHEQQTQWFNGVPDYQLHRLIFAMRPIVGKRSWPIIPYTPKNGEKAALKVKPIVAILHNVYNFKKRTPRNPVVFFNPESPKIFVEIDAVIEGNSSPDIAGMTVGLPGEYIRNLYGLSTIPVPTDKKNYNYEIDYKGLVVQ